MTLEEMCKRLGWDATELSRQAGINQGTARRAMRGESVSPRTAREIAKCLSEAFGYQVNPGDIEGLVIS